MKCRGHIGFRQLEFGLEVGMNLLQAVEGQMIVEELGSPSLQAVDVTEFLSL